VNEIVTAAAVARSGSEKKCETIENSRHENKMQLSWLMLSEGGSEIA
jgi:hypothetical protein